MNSTDALPVITALKPLDAQARRWSVHVNGEEVAKIPYSRLSSLGLSRGQAWTPTLEHAVKAAASDDALREYALRVLSRHPCSRARMADKLRRRGADEAQRESLLDELERLGALDDVALAGSVVRSELSRQPAGRRLLEQKLRAKGIEREESRRVLDEAMEGRDHAADARAAAEKKMRSLSRVADLQVRRRRLYAYLVRRGFDADVCREVVREFEGDSEA